ncbi:DNA cytosine methyltransferase [Paenibacillus sepulcri]
METVVFCEQKPFPQRVLHKHWPAVPIIDDVHDFTKGRLDELGIGTIDLVSAGYPCQPASFAGKRRGEEDDRWLWPEVRRVLSEVRPRWFIGENVFGHVSLGLDTVLTDLEDDGYAAEAIVIPAAAVYASHRRDRVIVLGYSQGNDARGLPIGERAPDTGPACTGENVADSTGERCREARRDKRGRFTKRTPGSSENVGDTECGGREGESRRRSEPELANGHRGMESELVANASNKGLPQRGRSGRPPGVEEAGAGMDNKFERCREDVADSSGAGQQKCKPTGFSDRSGFNSGSSDARWTIRAAEPGMGGNLDELSGWVDGSGLDANPLNRLKQLIHDFPQPALIGQPQYTWEPARVNAGVKNRVSRLEALGNAVDPLQIFPILYAMRLIDEWLISSKEEAY